MKPTKPKLPLIMVGMLMSLALTAQSLRRDTLTPISLEMPGISLGDRVAAFPGGQQAWELYVSRNLVYPKKARKMGRQGIAIVWFKVDTLGRVSDAKAIIDPGGGLGDEAVRLLTKGPAWIPAQQSGKKVCYRQVQAVHFNLQQSAQAGLSD